MSDRMMIGNLFPGKIHPAALHNERKTAQAQHHPPPGTFQELLNENLLKISNHAAKRLQQRGIELKGDQLEQIQSAVDRAAAKGEQGIAHSDERHGPYREYSESDRSHGDGWQGDERQCVHANR